MKYEYMLYDTTLNTCNLFESLPFAKHYLSKYLNQKKLDSGYKKYEIIKCEHVSDRNAAEIILNSVYDQVLDFAVDILDDGLTVSEIIDTNLDNPIKYMYVQDYID